MIEFKTICMMYTFHKLFIYLKKKSYLFPEKFKINYVN